MGKTTKLAVFDSTKANLATSHAICCDAWRNSGSFQTSNATAMRFKQGLIETRFQYYSWLSKKKHVLSPTRIFKGCSRLRFCFLCVFLKKNGTSEAFLDLYTCHSFVHSLRAELWRSSSASGQWPACSQARMPAAKLKASGTKGPAKIEKMIFRFFHYSHLQTLVIRLPHPCPAVRHL